MKRIYPQDKRTKAQKTALELFDQGFDAFVKQHTIPPAMNEGDYSKYYWAGFFAAREVLNKSRKESLSYHDMKNSVHNYDDPIVNIKWRYSK